MKSILLGLGKYSIIAVLFIALLVLNYYVWSKDREQEKQIKQLQMELSSQLEENSKVKSINEGLRGKITSLKTGSHETIEEEARKGFGMVRDDETYYFLDEEKDNKTKTKKLKTNKKLELESIQ